MLGHQGLARLSLASARHLLQTRGCGRPVKQCRYLCSSKSSSIASGAWAHFWKWTTQQRPSWRESSVEAAVAFVVFGITGTTSVAVVRPALKKTIGLEGSMREGPWSYRITSLVLVSPIYACFLVTFGTLAGRHTFFANMARKIFGRFVPPSLATRMGVSKPPPPV
mmetsp:Transcript_58550/g.96641  ORF Transcript_58550/g.96641 Transcript_58550/m.96641 type:complete len:166 (-) Transcript_58550:422-919(-)